MHYLLGIQLSFLSNPHSGSLPDCCNGRAQGREEMGQQAAEHENICALLFLDSRAP